MREKGVSFLYMSPTTGNWADGTSYGLVEKSGGAWLEKPPMLSADC